MCIRDSPLSEVCPALTASTTMRMAWITTGALSIMMLCPECVSVMCTAPGTSAASCFWAADCQSPGAARKNHIDFKVCEFRCELRKKFRFVVSGSVFKFDIPPLSVTGLA